MTLKSPQGRFLAERKTMGLSLSDFLEQQRREALGAVNKWYCSQCLGYEVTDPEVLLAYYIKNGGALRFRQDHEMEASLMPSSDSCR